MTVIEIIDEIGFGLVNGWICDYSLTEDGRLVIMTPNPENFDEDIFFVCENWIKKEDRIEILDLRRITEKEWSSFL